MTGPIDDLLRCGESPPRRGLAGAMVLALMVGAALAAACGSEDAPRAPKEGAPGARQERPVPAFLEGTPQGTVAAGDLRGVRALLDGGKPVELTDEHGSTLLHIAAIHGRRDIAAFLLGRGAAVEARDASGDTPLHGAAYAIHWMPPGGDHGMRLVPGCGVEHLAVAELLVAKGADVKATDRNRWTPLHLAARGGNPNVAAFLIERGADVRAVDESGVTPLHLAADGGNHEPMLPQFTVLGEHAAVARLLLSKGADADAASLMGTPLARAARHGASDVAEVLLAAGADSTGGPTEGLGMPPALHAAAYAGDARLVDKFLAKGASVEARDRSGRTPLFMAALGGREDAAKLLLDRGAEVGAAEDYGDTPGHAAARSGSVATLELLLDRGADARAKSRDGDTLLHAAAEGCRAGEAMLSFLVERGLEIDARNRAGKTPLGVASSVDCLIGGSPMEEPLLRRGAKR
jgi:ankyrin repeat protein